MVEREEICLETGRKSDKESPSRHLRFWTSLDDPLEAASSSQETNYSLVIAVNNFEQIPKCLIPPGKQMARLPSIGLTWPLSNRHTLGVAPSTFTTV